MEAIKINVNKQMDGYTFSIAPSIREMIKTWFPNAHPANNIFVSYDAKSDFEVYYGKLESYIYPALLGVDNQSAGEFFAARLVRQRRAAARTAGAGEQLGDLETRA